MGNTKFFDRFDVKLGCWLIKNSYVQKMHVVEMRMLRWMCGHSRSDKIRNVVIREKVRVAFVADKMR